MYMAHRTLVHCIRTLLYDIILQQKSVLLSDTMQSMAAQMEFAGYELSTFVYILYPVY